MSIPMLRVDQSDHLKLYTCALTTGFLQAMIYCLPRSLENFEGIQRALVMKKISGIEERLSSGPHGFPNAIVITLRCQDSPYITVAPLESRTSDSSGIVLLTVALHRYREHIAACAADEAGYLLAPEQELLGYMIDGHHRTEGAYAAGKLDSPSSPASTWIWICARWRPPLLRSTATRRSPPPYIPTPSATSPA
ncbi:MAG: hypothetical protein ACLRNQ_23300 [Flavonifractor plautii]